MFKPRIPNLDTGITKVAAVVHRRPDFSQVTDDFDIEDIQNLEDLPLLCSAQLFILNVPFDITEDELQDKLTRSGYFFEDHDVRWANHHIDIDMDYEDNVDDYVLGQWNNPNAKGKNPYGEDMIAPRIEYSSLVD